jgi:TRAP-type C4-dicarboxylate transport system permease small subunit
VGAGALQVCFRYVFNAPLRWPEEVSRLLLVWLTYLGALVLPESRLHVAVDVLYDRLPPAARWRADLLTDLLGAAFHGILVVAGFGLVAAMDGIRLPALQLPLSLLVGILPVAALLQVYLHAAAVVRALRGAAGPPGGGR